MINATAILEELIDAMGDGQGPIERVVGEWTGPDVALAAARARGAPYEAAIPVIAELGDSWGATGDPTWVDGLIPGRDDEDDGAPHDYMFALYRRPRIYAYVGLRGDGGDPPARMRMILGVLRKPSDHGD